MTNVERARCEKLVEEAKDKLISADIEYAKYERLQKENAVISAECALRLADQWRGYAEGIYQALAVIGYSSKQMEELTEKI